LASRSEIGPVIGSAVSATGAAISWTTGNAFLTAVLAAAAGSFVTIYFAGVQQKQAWKREVAVRMTTELYGPLYVDIWKAIQAFDRKGPRSTLQTDSYDSELWHSIVADYRYRVIDKDLRQRLDEFYVLIQATTSLWYRITDSSDRLFLESARTVLGKKNMTSAIWGCIATTPAGGRTSVGGFSPAIIIAQGGSVMKYIRENLPDYTNVKFPVQIQYAQGPGENLEIGQEQARSVFDLAESSLHQEEVYRNREEKRGQLLKLGASLRERLGVIVEQPWKS
jgi:hypothetical protein